MRIGLDVRYLSHGLVGGVRMYVAQFVSALMEIAREHEIVLYADSKRPFELRDLPANVRLSLVPWRSPLSSIASDLWLARRMARDQLDVAHFTGNYGFGPRGVPTVVTLQDEINLLPLAEIIRGHKKDLRTIAMMTYLHAITTAAVRRADLVLTISEYSRCQILRYSPIRPEHIVVLHHACPDDMRPVTDETELREVSERLQLRGPFILAEAFKNPAVIVRAWHRLAPALRQGHEIIFFSRSRDVIPVVNEAVAAGYARLLVRPARRDLSALYSMAGAFVFPSWIEGFGIPLVEAMTCGAPVIASNRGAIPEVVGDAARIIDAEDDQMLARYLAELLENPAVAAELRARGLARAAQFSWSANARQVIGLYQRLAEGRLEAPGVARRQIRAPGARH